MKFLISPNIFKKFPSLFIGVVVSTGVDNTKQNQEITNLLRDSENTLKSQISLPEITTHPHIAPWREAYQKFGSDPRDFRPSNEALVRAVLNDRKIRSINSLVDLYNLVSLKYILTLGGEDLDKIQGDLVLDFATGAELFVPLGSTESDPPEKGEVVYKDDFGVLCRRWNWREGDRTKLTKETKNAIFVVEGLSPISNDLVKSATTELSGVINKFCGGKQQIYFLEKDRQSIKT